MGTLMVVVFFKAHWHIVVAMYMCIYVHLLYSKLYLDFFCSHSQNTAAAPSYASNISQIFIDCCQRFQNRRPLVEVLALLTAAMFASILSVLTIQNSEKQRLSSM